MNNKDMVLCEASADTIREMLTIVQADPSFFKTLDERPKSIEVYYDGDCIHLLFTEANGDVRTITSPVEIEFN